MAHKARRRPSWKKQNKPPYYSKVVRNSDEWFIAGILAEEIRNEINREILEELKKKWKPLLEDADLARTNSQNKKTIPVLL